MISTSLLKAVWSHITKHNIELKRSLFLATYRWKCVLKSCQNKAFGLFLTACGWKCREVLFKDLPFSVLINIKGCNIGFRFIFKDLLKINQHDLIFMMAGCAAPDSFLQNTQLSVILPPVRCYHCRKRRDSCRLS